jgi:hypothetical protein
MGHPFGMIQRRVRRDVTSITSVPAPARRRKGNAAY